MSAIRNSERETQNLVIALFRDELHYRYLGDWSEHEGNSNFEEVLLSAFLSARGTARNRYRERCTNCGWRRTIPTEACMRATDRCAACSGTVFMLLSSASKKMKTWCGTCNPELAKKPKECLEYIVVLDMVHLLEPIHNQRFADRMNTVLPQWKPYRDLLNRLPVGHEDWGY